MTHPQPIPEPYQDGRPPGRPFSRPGDETALAGRLLEAVGPAAVRAGRPVWALVLDRPGGGTDVAVPDHDFDPLGWTAPPECSAVGVVATGRVRSLDAAAELPAGLAGARPGGARLACVVSRRDRIGWRMLLPDGTSFDDAPEEGRLLDILRRCLGLPTAPPPVPSDVLVTSAWLVAVCSAGRPDRPLTWRQALALHPVVEQLGPFAGTGPDGAPDPQVMEAIVRVCGFPGTWEELRAVAAADPEPRDWLPAPDLAAWMDEGMFARWILAGLLDVEELLDRARPLLRPSAARRLAHLARVGAGAGGPGR